jgi:hypothetical protein
MKTCRFPVLVAIWIIGLASPGQEGIGGSGKRTMPKAPGDRVGRSTLATNPRGAPSAARPYKEAGSFDIKDVIDLDGKGHRWRIQVLPPGGAAEDLAVKFSVSGSMEFLGFSFGKDSSTFTILSNGKVTPVFSSTATSEVVATGSGLFTHMVTDSPNGTLVLDTNQHARVLQFKLAEARPGVPIELRIHELSLGSSKYNFTVRFNR